MAEITFYHLVSTSLDQALPKLLEKSLQAGFRVNIRVSSDAEAERLNAVLWSYTTDSFLPHGVAKDGHSEAQPIFNTPGKDNPNQATLLVITHAELLEEGTGFARMLDIFNGTSESEVSNARLRWSEYKLQGHALSYIRQNDTGGWEKQSA